MPGKRRKRAKKSWHLKHTCPHGVPNTHNEACYECLREIESRRYISKYDSTETQNNKTGQMGDPS